MLPIPISETDLSAFCRRWKIVEVAVFGSALRADFGPESDIDLLVTFDSEAKWSYFDHMHMELELVELLHREVDIIDRAALDKGENSLRQKEILQTAQVILPAPEINHVVGQ